MSSNFWVIGGEFGSMNFHKLVEGSAQVQGPFKSRKEAEDAWRTVSEENRHKAGVRFSIVEEPSGACTPDTASEDTRDEAQGKVGGSIRLAGWGRRGDSVVMQVFENNGDFAGERGY